MNYNTKSLIAILSVMFMLGCALVPLATYDSSGTVADDSNADTGDSSLIDTLINAKDAHPSLKSRPYMFVPVETKDVQPTVLATNVTEEKVIKNQTVTLDGDYVFGSAEGGKIGKYIIGEGSTLVLFPLGDINTSFTIRNLNDDSSDANDQLIVLNPGSKICIFGMTFEFIPKTGTQQQCNLLSLDVAEDEDWYCKVSYVHHENGSFEFSVYLGCKDITLTLVKELSFQLYKIGGKKGVSPECGNVISAKGTLNPSSEDIGIVFSGDLMIRAFMPHNNEKQTFTGFTYHFDKMSLSYVPHSTGADVKLSVSAKLDFDLKRQTNKYLRYEIHGMSFETGDIAISIAKSNDGLSINISSPDAIKWGIDDCSVVFVPFKGLTTTISPSDSVLTFTRVNMSMDYVPGGGGWALDTCDAVCNIDVLCKELKSVVFYEEQLDTHHNKVNIVSDFRDASINIDDFSYELSGTDTKIVAKQINGTKTMADSYSLFNGSIHDDVIFTHDIFNSWYEHEFTTEITNFQILETPGSKKGVISTSIEFDHLRSGFAVSQRTSEWNGEFVVDDFDVSFEMEDYYLESLVIDDVDIGSISFVNNIPMMQAFSILPEYVQSHPGAITIPNIEFEMTGISYQGGADKIEVSEIVLDVKKYKDVDDFSIDLSGNIIIQLQKVEDKVSVKWITCNEIEGYIIDTGTDKQVFSIKDSPKVKFNLDIEFDESFATFPEIIKYDAVFEIINGTARFEGGTVYFGIKVDSGVDFYAEGLSALGFEFAEDCEMSGEVSLDTDVTLPFCYSMEQKSIKIGSNYMLTPSTDGYVITLDLTDPTKGTLEANYGCKLPSSFKDGSFSMKSSDLKTGTFTVGNTGGEVKMVCTKDKYNVTYAGLQTQSYAHGSLVIIPAQVPTKEGLEFFGWNDGTSIRYPGDSFIMPTHDITLTPVYYKTVAPDVVTEDGKTILVVSAPDADMVKVNLPEFDWDLIRVTVGKTTIEFKESVFNELLSPSVSRESKCDALYFQSAVTELSSKSNDGSVTKMTAYDVKIYYSLYDRIAMKEVTKQLYRCMEHTSFGITINTSAGSNLKDFKVYEVESDGHLRLVENVTYVKCNDGTYNVSFAINHGAKYAIEPVYPESSTPDLTSVIAIVIMVALLLVAGVYFWSRENKN